MRWWQMQAMTWEEKMDFAAWAIRFVLRAMGLGRTDTDRSDHLMFCSLSPWSVAHRLPRKRRRREKSKLLLTSPPKMWDPPLIVARCCSREWEGKSVLFSLKVAECGRVSHQLQLSGKTQVFFQKLWNNENKSMDFGSPVLVKDSRPEWIK